MCDRPPAVDAGDAEKSATRLTCDRAGGNTAECHVVRGYRFHRPSVSGSGCLATRVGVLSPTATSQAEPAVQPKAMWKLKRHSAFVRVITAGSAARRLLFAVQASRLGWKRNGPAGR